MAVRVGNTPTREEHLLSFDRKRSNIAQPLLSKRKELIDAFSDILFEEEAHTYTTPDGEILTPTSNMIKNFYEPFNSQMMSSMFANGRDLPVEDVRSAWEGEGLRATDYGTKVHLFGENYGNYMFFNQDVPIRRAECKKELAIIQWFNDRCLKRQTYIPLVFELSMYHKKYGYAGTADLVMWHPKSGKIVLADFKTNHKELKATKYAKPMKDPFNYLSDNSYGKYTLQFAFYQIMLEDMGFEVGGRELLWLNEDKENKKLYTSYFPNDVTKDLRKWLEENCK